MDKVSLRTLFLVDGLGAAATAVGAGVVLPFFEAWHGIPRAVLYGLAGLGVLFAMYSLGCYVGVRTLTRSFVKPIVLGNLTYCLVSAFLFVWLDSLTVWGRAYLLGEIGIILALVAWELRVSRHWP